MENNISELFGMVKVLIWVLVGIQALVVYTIYRTKRG